MQSCKVSKEKNAKCKMQAGESPTNTFFTFAFLIFIFPHNIL